jgi:hypothetical protein
MVVNFKEVVATFDYKGILTNFTGYKKQNSNYKID